MPLTALFGVGAEAVISGAGGKGTVTFVQELQLLFSSDSVITPEFAELLLSAQTLIEGVIPAAKVIEGEVAVAVPLATSVLIEPKARSVIVPPPFTEVAFWKK